MSSSVRFEANTTTSSDGSQQYVGVASSNGGHRSSLGPSPASTTLDRAGVTARDNYSAAASVVAAAAAATVADPISSLSQLLSLEKIPLGEDRYARQPELKRATNAATCSFVEDASAGGTLQVKALDTFGAEELKRVKASVNEISSIARDRARRLGEAIVKLDKYRGVRKRGRAVDVGGGGGIGMERCSSQLKVNPTPPPPEVNNTITATKPVPDKNKSTVPNKRLRTSIAEARPSNMKKSADRDSPKSASLLPSPGDDKLRIQSADLHATKSKGRRSFLKADPSTPASVGGVSESSERDAKWSGQHRFSQETRPRSSEVHGLRSGPVHGVTSSQKGESSASRGGVSKDVDVAAGLDKPKACIKPPTPVSDELLTPAPVTKGKAARAPRSAAANPSHINRVATLGIDREKTAAAAAAVAGPASGKGQLPTRKRPASSRSTSPVAQWGGQRPQKMARVARRVNLPPGGASAPVLPDATASNGSIDVLLEREPAMNGISAIPSGVSRKVSAHSPTQSKPRSERTVVSESEESEEVGDTRKSRKQQGEAWTSALAHKPCNLVQPPKMPKEDTTDGVRGQGRSGRSFSMPKAIDKADVTATVANATATTVTAKQLRSSRVEKPDRPGRTPTKKATGDRKALPRIRRLPGGHAVADAGCLITQTDSDDDHDELANAVRAAVDATATSCRSEFWKEMEPHFAFITADDLAYLRELSETSWNGDKGFSTPSADGIDRTSQLANGNMEVELAADVRGVGWFDKIYPLSQRLLAALITADGEDHGDKISETDGLKASESGNYSNGHGHFSVDEAFEPDDIVIDISSRQACTPASMMDGLCPGQASTAWQLQYERMSFDERVLLELHSIGLAVEQVPDLSQRDEDEICMEIGKLQQELKDKASVNKERVEALERAVVSRRDAETRERERLALSKLVEIAYTKRKGCRGSSGAAKGAKGARAAALAFSKRTLARVRQFDNGHSCFCDPALRDVLFCTASKQQQSGGAEQCTPADSAARRREKQLERDGGVAAIEDMERSALGSGVAANIGFGGAAAKGKRSERERDGKKERKNEAAAARPVKGERKTKTKPRRLPGKQQQHQHQHQQQQQQQQQQHQQEQQHQPVMEANMALEQPAVLELVDPAVVESHDDDIGAWLMGDALEDTTLQEAHGEFLIGLDVPMDDLSDLNMMM